MEEKMDLGLEMKASLNGVMLEWGENARVNKEAEVKPSYKLGVSLKDLLHRVKNEEPPKMIYSAIREGAVGLFPGQSKSGKTTFAENLLQNIAAGSKEFLGSPINVKNNRVLFYSLEEPYNARGIRNNRQVRRLIAKYGSDFLDNYVTNDDKMPRFINLLNIKDWELVKDFIKEVNPSIAVLDSFTHIYNGSIEDSSLAKAVMERLVKLAEETAATIAVIHHTYKLKGGAITMDTIAGSRVLQQESEFMIGFNRTMSGVYYMKDLAFRYAQSDIETARAFTIDEDCCINLSGNVDERELLAMADGRSDDTNRNKIISLFRELSESGNIIVPTKALYERYLANKEMSKPTIHDSLNKLVIGGKITKLGTGEYQLVA